MVKIVKKIILVPVWKNLKIPKHFGILLLLFALLIVAGCKDNQFIERQQVAISFYNCENFFDYVHTGNYNDYDFTPSGKYQYFRKEYERKLHNINTVFQSMGDHGKKIFPAIIGLAEVESRMVIDDMIGHAELRRLNYHYVITDGPDPRGINIAFLYRAEQFTLISSETIPIDLSSVNKNSKTRDILHIYGVLLKDTVHIFVNHWPSRREESEESETKRKIAAETLEKHISAIPNGRIIVMGDFNDNPDNRSISGVLKGSEDIRSTDQNTLYNPFLTFYESGMGTEKFDDNWNLFDQIMISRPLTHATKNHLHYESAEIYKPDFLISHKKDHEGEPLRSTIGPHCVNGYSDHFPVLLYLED